MSKKKKIVFSRQTPRHDSHPYIVKKLFNMLEPTVGNSYSKKVVQGYVDNPKIEVEIIQA